MGYCTFSSFFVLACDGFQSSRGWSFGCKGEERLTRDNSSGLLVVMPIGMRQDIDQIGLFKLLDGLWFDEVLGYVAFERVRNID